MASTPPYSWIYRKPDTWTDDLTGATTSGYKVAALWTATQTPIILKVPTAQYTPDQVNNLVLAAGAKEDAMAKLGATPEV